MTAGTAAGIGLEALSPVRARIGSGAEVTGIGGRFETDSLRVPVSLDLLVWMKVPKSWMMASLLVGVALLLLVAVELALRNLYALIRGADGLREVTGGQSDFWRETF